MNIAPTHTPSHLNDDLLNAWLDGEVTSSEAEEIQAHLAGCERCRKELESLREVKTLLAALPEARLPRSFTLSPEQAVRHPDPAPASNVIRLMPVTRILSIAAVIAFLVLGAANAFGPVTESMRDDDNAAPVNTTLSAAETNADAEASVDEEQAPVRAAAPGQVVDRGTSATSSNAMLEPVSEALPERSDDGLPALRIAWLTSGGIAIVALLAWFAIKQLTPASRDHSS